MNGKDRPSEGEIVLKGEDLTLKARKLQVLQVLKSGATRRAAYRFVGVTEDAFNHWLANPEYLMLVQQAEAEVDIVCTASLLKAARTDWRAALAVMVHRRPDEWRKVEEINYRNLTNEQLLELVKAGRPELAAASGAGARAAGDQSRAGDPETAAGGSDGVQEPPHSVLPRNPWGRAVE